jgi:hypothetical protein
MLRGSCVKKKEKSFICVNIILQFVHLIYTLEVQGQRIEHIAAFSFFLFGLYQCHKVSDTNGTRNKYVDQKVPDS